MAIYNETFTGATLAEADLPWSVVTGAWDIQSGSLNMISDYVHSYVRADIDLSGIDQYAEAVIPTSAGLSGSYVDARIYLRSSAVDQSSYFGMIGFSSSDNINQFVQIWRQAGDGTQTDLTGRVSIGTITLPVTLRFEAVGNDFRVLVNGSQVVFVTDTGGPAGLRTGLGGYRNGTTSNRVVQFDTFEIGDTVAPLSVDIGADQSIYDTQSAYAFASTSGGSGPKSYLWTQVSGPTASLSGTTTDTVTLTPTGGIGTYTLQCEVSDDSGTAQDEIVVTVTAVPNLVFYNTITISAGWSPTGGTVLGVLSDNDDDTFITSTDNPTDLVLDGTLSPMSPPASGMDLIMRVRGRSIEATSASLVGRLYNSGGVLISTTSAIPIVSVLTNVDLVFPASDLVGLAAAEWSNGMRVTISATAT